MDVKELFPLCANSANIRGIGTAIAGTSIGKKLESTDLNAEIFKAKNKTSLSPTSKYTRFPFSTAWLIADILSIITVLVLANRINTIAWFGISTMVVVGWILHYKVALRRLAQPKLWISFFIITLIAAIAFSQFQSGVSVWQGALIGLEMNVRAIVMVIGFAVIGTELYSPKIKNLFQKRTLISLYLALDLSAESLPNMIALVPNLKEIFKHPIDIVKQFLSYAEYRMQQIELRKQQKAAIAIITGEKSSGKTRFLTETAMMLKENGIAVGGVYTKKVRENNEITGYRIVDAATEEEFPFLQKNTLEGELRIGAFSIDSQGLAIGQKAIEKSFKSNVLIIDEIGKLEMNGGGWHNELNLLPLESQLYILLSVRQEFVDEVIEKWNLQPAFIYNVAESKPETLVEEITAYFKEEEK